MEEVTKSVQELEKKPSILWRGFRLSPQDLSLELFQKPLIINQNSVPDENESGVYMSTNPSVATMYAQEGPIPGLFLKAEQPFNQNGPTSSILPLPAVGVTMQIDTEGLSIRKPKIAHILSGHYNNDLPGDEWIADEIPPHNYTVTTLSLDHSFPSGERVTLQVDGKNPEELAKAIQKIQSAFVERKKQAEEFIAFVNRQPAAVTRDSFTENRAWNKYLQSKDK